MHSTNRSHCCHMYWQIFLFDTEYTDDKCEPVNQGQVSLIVGDKEADGKLSSSFALNCVTLSVKGLSYAF